MACPFVGATYDCTQKVVQPTGRFGLAVLKLDKTVRYHLFATVTNPNPAWACPGLAVGPDIVYLSKESFDGLPDQLPQLTNFTIVKPDPADCAPVTVVDDSGSPVPGAGLFINNDPANGLTDPNGVIRVKVTPGTTYEVGAFLANSGWPCPAYTSPDGSTFHFSEQRTVTAEQLVAGQTFIIPKPTIADCVPVTVVDDSGNPIPGAGLFINNGFGNGLTDPNGVIRVKVTPGTTYEVGAFLANSGWPCPSYTSPDGSTFHFSEQRTVTAEQLLAGQTFIIPKPDPSDCTPPPPVSTGSIRMFDLSGTPLPQAMISYCEYDPSTPPSYPNEPGTDCPRGNGFRGPDGDGVIRVPVTNPNSNLDITGLLACTDGSFLFGDHNNSTSNGYSFWTISASDLVTNGLDLTIIGNVAACLAPAPPT